MSPSPHRWDSLETDLRIGRECPVIGCRQRIRAARMGLHLHREHPEHDDRYRAATDTPGRDRTDDQPHAEHGRVTARAD